MQKFLVFKCPKCGAFLYAPVRQKTRRCTYCNHIIKINPAESQLVESIEEASKLVKQYNAKKNSDEFIMAVEASRESIVKLYEYLDMQETESISDDKVTYISGGKSRTLFSLLVQFAKNPITLDKFRALAEKYKLDWQWVTDSLEKLSQDGIIIFPKPWEIQLVSESEIPGIKETTPVKSKKSMKSLERAIIEFLEAHNMPIKTSELILEFNKYGYSDEEIQKVINGLIASGVLYEPRVNWISLV